MRSNKDSTATSMGRRQVRELMKSFAVKTGWPEVRQYGASYANWELLEGIPGSFPDVEEDDCPLDPITRAYVDLLPTLLAEGHEGKWLAFGYGPRWYAVGTTEQEALAGVMARHPYQMPHLVGRIEADDLGRSRTERYHQWKLERAKADTVEVNSAFPT